MIAASLDHGAWRDAHHHRQGGAGHGAALAARGDRRRRRARAAPPAPACRSTSSAHASWSRSGARRRGWPSRWDAAGNLDRPPAGRPRRHPRGLVRLAPRHRARRRPLRRRARRAGRAGGRRRRWAATPLARAAGRRRLPRRGGLALRPRLLRQPGGVRPRDATDELRAADADGVTRPRRAGRAGPGGRRPSAGPLPGDASSRCTSSRARCSSAAGAGHAVVGSIAGMAGYTATIHGERRPRRDDADGGPPDAFVAAAELALRAARRGALTIPGAVVTTGDVRIARPAANVVPGRVRACGRRPRAVGRGAGRAAGRRRARAPRRSRRRTGCTVDLDRQWHEPPGADVRARPRRAVGCRGGGRASPSPSCRPAPATTPACWPPQAWTPGCSSSAA